MPVYFEYAFKTSICLAIVFLFYRLLLKQITWYTWNRFFLLAFAAFSFIAPFININFFIESGQLEFIPMVNFVQHISDKAPSNQLTNHVAMNYWKLLSVLYIFIGLLLFIRLIIQILSIKKIKSEANLTLTGEVEIYHIPKPILPFSFLKSIFINQHNYNNTELQEIIDHERVHVREKHTFDVLITELICIVNWYNPFAWLIKKAIRENLEFIADDAVIQKGFDRKSYQYLLLKVTGVVPSSIVNNFNFTSLKNRIRMMNKTKTGRLHLLRFALVVPLATILLLAFRNNHEVSKTAPVPGNMITQTYILSSLTYAVPDKKVEAELIKDKGNCLLKTGQALDLDMVFNEKARLTNFLQKIGYTDVGLHAITFMIDTTLANNSFSIQVNISLIKDDLSKTNNVSANSESSINTQIEPQNKILSRVDDRVMLSRSLLVQTEAR
ncbi:MAG: M56 family metallopeptidase [Ferruginibacter sp.]